MSKRGRILGSHRLAAQLDAHGVCVEEIPVFPPPFDVLPYSDAPLVGRAPKDFVVVPSADAQVEAYIAKKWFRQHSGPRECVTEYLLARIGAMLPLRVARARLVRLSDSLHDPDVRFMSRYFLRPGRDHLRHGIELFTEAFEVTHEQIAQEIGKGDPERAFFTVDLIDELLENASKSPANHCALRDGFARMLTYDALVGSQDRHPTNWGIIEDAWGKDEPKFAPVFDTARGLFLQLDEDALNDVDLVRFALRAKPLIGTGDKHTANHFALIRFLLIDRHHVYGHAVRSVIQGFDPDACRRMMRREFSRLLSRKRLELIDRLLRLRHRTLLALLRGEDWDCIWRL